LRLSCPECGAEIPASNINLDRMVAKCEACNTVFSFDNKFAAVHNVQTLNRLDVPRPSRVEVQNTGAELIFRWRWMTATIGVAAVFALMWNGFLAVWFTIAILSRIWIMALFGTLHLLIGLYLAYYVISGIINSTTVKLGMGELAIEHGPMPARGNMRIPTASILQLYTKEVQSRSRNSVNTYYELHAATNDGKSVKLIGTLDTSEQALYMEQEIERYLRIEDQPVRGEVAR
jgi:predicted Zn finger-like uncharacterized protein